MKSERFFEILGDTDEALLAESERPRKRKLQFNLRIATIAACLLLSFSLLLNVLMYAFGGASMMEEDRNTIFDDVMAPSGTDKESVSDGWDSSANLGNSNGGSSGTQWETKIVRNARLEAETKRYTEAVAALREAIADAQGYVSESNEKTKTNNNTCYVFC